jgi:predicted DsbA family dithiol-disulfide isomerase
VIAIEHFTDPTCPFAFSAEPQRWRLRWLYGDQLRWTDRMVVLSENPAELEEKFPPPAHAEALAAVQARYGMPIDARVRERSAASAPACLAVVAARLHAPDRSEALLRALRLRIMGGELPDEPATIAAAAQEAGLDPSELQRWMDGDDARTALAEDRAEARDPVAAARALDHKLGGPPEERRYTCPSYVVQGNGSSPHAAPGFQPLESYEVLLANIAPDLGRREDPSGAAEVLEWAGTPLATVEVAALLGTDADGAREALADAGAVERPSGADAYWSL